MRYDARAKIGNHWDFRLDFLGAYNRPTKIWQNRVDIALQVSRCDWWCYVCWHVLFCAWSQVSRNVHMSRGASDTLQCTRVTWCMQSAIRCNVYVSLDAFRMQWHAIMIACLWVNVTLLHCYVPLPRVHCIACCSTSSLFEAIWQFKWNRSLKYERKYVSSNIRNR